MVRRQIEKNDFVGEIENRIGNRFTDRRACDLTNRVAATADVLNVKRGINIDSGIEQLEHILITFRMTRAGRVGVRQLINNCEFRMPGEDGVEIHLLELCSAIFDLRARHDRHSFQQRFGFLASVRFHYSDHHLASFRLFLPRGLQHGVGLADTGRHPEENLEFASR